MLSCVRLSWIIARWVPLSMEFSRKEYRSAFPFPFPNPGIKLRDQDASPESSALADRFFTPCHLGSPCERKLNTFCDSLFHLRKIRPSYVNLYLLSLTSNHWPWFYQLNNHSHMCQYFKISLLSSLSSSLFWAKYSQIFNYSSNKTTEPFYNSHSSPTKTFQLSISLEMWDSEPNVINTTEWSDLSRENDQLSGSRSHAPCVEPKIF